MMQQQMLLMMQQQQKQTSMLAELFKNSKDFFFARPCLNNFVE